MVVTVSEQIGSPDEMFRRLGDKQMNTLRVAIPGIIQSFDPVTQTVVVQPALRERVKDQDGNLQWVQLPVLPDVPIVLPRAGGYVLTMPVQAGDECLVVFADSCIDAWWSNGGIQNQIEMRRHDLSDAFAILGAWSQPNTIPNYNTTAAQLRTIDGASSLSIGPTGTTVVGGVWLPDSAITNAMLATGINGAKLGAGTVPGSALATGIDGAKLNAGSVLSSALVTAINGKDLTSSTKLTVDSPTLVVDATNHRVGVGTATPGEKLHIEGNIRSGNHDTSVSRYIGNTISGIFPGSGMEIEPVVVGGNYSQKVHFHTHHYGAGGGRRLTIDPDGNVGIGTAAPSTKLEINGALKFSNGSTDTNDGRIGSGLFAAGLNFVGINTDATVRKINIWGGVTQSQNDRGNTWVGNSYFPGSGIWDAAGNIGIGTTAPPCKLYVNGDAKISGYTGLGGGGGFGAYTLDVNGTCHASSFPTSSDARFKDKVANLPIGILDKVKRLRGVSFEWNDLYKKDLKRNGQEGLNIGFIAQEIEQEFPELVSKWGEGNPNYEHGAEEYRGVDYGRMVPVLLEAIKELSGQVDILKEQVATLMAAGGKV